MKYLINVNDNKKNMEKTVDLKQKGNEFLAFVKNVQQKMKQKGLNEKSLNDILNDKS